MTFPILDPVFQTRLFILLFLVALVITTRKRDEPIGLSPRVSSELKGFAIIAIILAHIGYYLAQDHRFLFPLSVFAGVGVDLFLFLSGYGLAYSMLHKQLTLWQFYLRRVSRIFIPLWIILLTLFMIDKIFLDLSYPLKTILQSFVGFFPKAHLYESLNAPLWYLTFILFYYLLFPLVFWKKIPILSAFFLAFLGYQAVHLSLPIDEDLLKTYSTHVFAFPLGVFCASFANSKTSLLRKKLTEITDLLGQKKALSYFVRMGLLLGCISVACYFAIHSGVGKGVWIEQKISLLIMFAVIGVFLLKPLENRFLYWIGIHSYEIYLLHWPLLYRYDVLYSTLPAGLATFVYLFVFLGIAVLFQKLTQRSLTLLRIKA